MLPKLPWDQKTRELYYAYARKLIFKIIRNLKKFHIVDSEAIFQKSPNSMGYPSDFFFKMYSDNI